MDKIISATEARIRFGELLQVAQKQAIIVERGGEQIAVVISKREYDRLMSGQTIKKWHELVNESREQVRNELKGKSLPDPATILRQIREERDERYDLH